MTDMLKLQQQREADIAEVAAEIRKARASLDALDRKIAEPTRGLADRDEIEYERFQTARYLTEMETDLRSLNSEPVSPPEVTRSLAGPANGLAIIVGHSIPGGDPGAEGSAFPQTVTGTMRQEAYWNQDLARMIEAEAAQRQIPCKVFERKKAKAVGVKQAYRDALAWGCRAAVELHFNYYNKTARGTETLYATPESKAFASALQAGMLDVFRTADPNWADRKVKIPDSRGQLNITQLRDEKIPSALVEPFFGDNAQDAAVGEAMKRQYARAILDAYIKAMGLTVAAQGPETPGPTTTSTSLDPTTTTGPTGTGGGPTATPPGQAPVGPTAALAKPDGFSDRFLQLLLAYTRTPIEFPQLKDVSFAKWALETGYGAKSELAEQHCNFAGMKWREEMWPFATPVAYTDWQGKRENYCRFATYDDFIKAYWKRLDLVSAYDGWRRHTASGEAFITFVGPIWAPTSDGNENYQSKVLSVMRRLGQIGYLPSQIAAKHAPKPPGDGTSAPPHEGTPPAPGGETTPPAPGSGGSIHTHPPTGPAASPPAAFSDAALSGANAGLLAEGRRVIATPGTPPAVVAALGSTIAACTTLGEELLKAAAPPERPGQPVLRALPDVVRSVHPRLGPLFVELAQALELKGSLTRGARQAILAHWALESDWGRSELATIHYNLAGIAYDDSLDDVAGRILHGDKGPHCRFDDLDKFLVAYWRKLEAGGLTPQLETASAQEMAGLIAAAFRPSQSSYGTDLTSIALRIANADVSAAPSVPKQPGILDTGSPTPGFPPVIMPSGPTVGTGPTVFTPPSADVTGLPDGFVIRVKRLATERRAAGRHRLRTQGTYEAFYNRQKIPGLEGAMYEQKGPGDNTLAGRANQARIEAKLYPLHTHGFPGSAYRTYGYATSTEPGAVAPPAIRVGDTGDRTAILLHPGYGFLSSVGCLNFSKPLAGPNDGMDWIDSRQRAILMLTAMQERLGARFPKENGQLIPDAWLVVEGEPAGTRSLLESRSRSTSGRIELERSLSGEVVRRLLDGEVFEMLSDTISGRVLPEIVNGNMFMRILELRGFTPLGWKGWLFARAAKRLGALRGPRGETLWEAWASGWEASSAIPDPIERDRVQGELGKIADTLKLLGVDVNDPGQFQSPLSAAAARGAVAAVRELVKQGADVDKHDPSGNTPLIASAFAAAAATTRELLRLGARRVLKTVMPAPDEEELVRGLGEPRRTNYFAEAPPRNEDALAAARAGLSILGDPSSHTGSDVELARRYREIEEMLREPPPH